MKPAVLCILVAIGLACLSYTAYASSSQSSKASASNSQRTFGQIYTECGVGAMIAPKTPAVAAVTNVTWDLGTTAILSNMSSPSSCKGKKPQMASLIYTTYPSLESNLASGHGQNLNSLAALAGCSSEQQSSFVHSLRGRFAKEASVDGYTHESRRSKAATLFNAAQNARRGTCRPTT